MQQLREFSLKVLSEFAIDDFNQDSVVERVTTLFEPQRRQGRIIRDGPKSELGGQYLLIAVLDQHA